MKYLCFQFFDLFWVEPEPSSNFDSGSTKQKTDSAKLHLIPVHLVVGRNWTMLIYRSLICPVLVCRSLLWSVGCFHCARRPALSGTCPTTPTGTTTSTLQSPSVFLNIICTADPDQFDTEPYPQGYNLWLRTLFTYVIIAQTNVKATLSWQRSFL